MNLLKPQRASEDGPRAAGRHRSITKHRTEPQSKHYHEGASGQHWTANLGRYDPQTCSKNSRKQATPRNDPRVPRTEEHSLLRPEAAEPSGIRCFSFHGPPDFGIAGRSEAIARRMRERSSSEKCPTSVGMFIYQDQAPWVFGHPVPHFGGERGEAIDRHLEGRVLVKGMSL